MTRASSRGASFIEVAVAVMVLSVLLLTTLPQLLVPVQITAGRAARVTVADLVLARRLAIAGRAAYVVTFQPAAGPFTSYSVSPLGGSPGPDFPKTFPAGVRVTGTPQVTFAPDGSATSAALTFADGTATAQVQVLAATGFVQQIGP
jgi:hypothetical protein